LDAILLAPLDVAAMSVAVHVIRHATPPVQVVVRMIVQKAVILYVLQDVEILVLEIIGLSQAIRSRPMHCDYTFSLD
jgi:hypothetical protein